MRVGIRDQEHMITLDVDGDMVKASMTNETVKQSVLRHINIKYQTKFMPGDTEIIDLTGKHFCEYCGEAAEGEDENLLCEECRSLFGHLFYSEL